MEKLLILGSGPAGLTAGIYAARSDLKPKIADGPLPGGLLVQTGSVENFPGFPDGVDGFELTDRMRCQAERAGAVILNTQAVDVCFSCGGTAGHRVNFADGSSLECRNLIIATGSSPRWLGLASERRLRNKGVSACARCDGPLFRGMTVCVAGGGDTAMDEALFLAGFTDRVHLVHRRDQFRASQIMADRVRSEPKIVLHLSCTVEEILGTERVEGVRIRRADGSSETIPCAAFFSALGYDPNTGLFRDRLEMDPSGYIRTFDGTSRTSVPHVYAAGDCADPVYRQAVTAAASGCRAVLDCLNGAK
ncbi:MAG: FAD-dependent oxidoreductase [Lentisphaeria bacterium]|nr:FAD-dependent oxidoreductase [Lentisphaeria bacterium]